MAKKRRGDQERDRAAVRAVLDAAFEQATQLIDAGAPERSTQVLGPALGPEVARLGTQQHAARGILLTLAACKAADPSRNICLYKDKFPGGFDARGFDLNVVIRFLREKQVPHVPPEGSNASHWLTRSLAQEPYTRGKSLETQPDWVGTLLPKLVCDIQESTGATIPRKVVVALLVLRIQERERAKVALTKPKNLTILQSVGILRRHFSHKYKSRDKGPRLLQLAMYAMYQCLIEACSRYQGAELGKLESLRAANRKSGSFGDIDISAGQRPFEAVEVKFDIPITPEQVQDAIEKVKTTDLRRYYILSTAGVDPGQSATTKRKCDEFYYQNGCEIIVNGIYETISYYLRILGTPDLFVSRYLDLVSSDEELTFEHREAWNQITSLPDQPGP